MPARISGGNVTVMVSSMDRAVSFYSETLGLKLAERYGDHWATVTAGAGFTIGLHPASPRLPSPGTKGSMMIGLTTDEPIEALAERLRGEGVRFTGEIVKDGPGNFIDFEDPDGNALYFWETPIGSA